MRRAVWRVRSVIGLAAVPVVSIICQVPHVAVAQQAPPPAVLPQLGYSSLSTVRLGPINASITAFPLNSPPINGFVPQVVFGLTNQQAPNDEEFKAHPSSSPGGTSLPSGGAPQYFVATFDTGSQSHLVSYNDARVRISQRQ